MTTGGVILTVLGVLVGLAAAYACWREEETDDDQG